MLDMTAKRYCSTAQKVPTPPLPPGIGAGGRVEAGVPQDAGQQPDPIGTTRRVRHQNPTVIADGWAIGWDRLQWILLKGWRCKGGIKWQSIAFVGGKRSLLERILREKGGALAQDAEKALKRFPDTFTQFHKEITNA